MTEEKKPIDWEAVAAAQAKAFGLPVEDLTREVKHELTAHLAKEIAKAVFQDLNAGPIRWLSSSR